MLPETSLMAAFLAGLLSFVSPCVLPLVPSYVTYITGLSLGQLTNVGERHRARKTIILNALLFIAGFSGVFIAFGASASLIGQLLTDYQDLVRKIGGVLIVVFGLYLMGIVKLTFLMRERRFHFHSRPAGYVGSVFIGAAFAAGWTPCVGPVLGTVLMYASTTETRMDGVALLSYYSMGLGLPMFAVALGVDRFLVYFKQARAYLGTISTGSGVILVVFGIMLFTNALPFLTAFFEQYGIGSYLEP
ncbi:MAG: cytochrome c biogenesis CcdA family protein [Nitrospiraceae bacterium]